MHEISEDSELRNIVSEKEFRRSLTFSWGKCARETLEVYKDVSKRE
jgi:glycosyltransferase involved in cell wall biosynthesis